MAIISLSKGKFAIVDDGDFEYLNQWKWHVTANGYARRADHIMMHSLIMRTPLGMATDHINGNKLDNRRCNLRVCTQSENGRNRPKQINNHSGYKGVSWDKLNNKWRVSIQLLGKRMNLGRYADIQQAASVYDNAAEFYHSIYAQTNKDNI